MNNKKKGDRLLYIKKGDRHLKEEEPVPFFIKVGLMNQAPT
jgi:hypothetical protein